MCLISVQEIPEGLKIGDRISFDVDEPPEGHQGIPLARKVKRLAASTLKAAEDVGDGEEDEGDILIDMHHAWPKDSSANI